MSCRREPSGLVFGSPPSTFRSHFMSRTTVIAVVIATLLGFLAGVMVAEPPHPPAQDNQSALNDSNSNPKPPSEHAFVCPMHPSIHAAHADNCPICGMQLVPNEHQHSHESEAQQEHGGHPEVSIAAHVVHNLGIRTARVQRADLSRSIETIGKITRVDPSSRSTLTPPIKGQLIYLADKVQGDQVKRGELLFSVGSDALFALEKDYQQAVREGRRGDATQLVPKLRDLGITPEQLAQLQQREQADVPVEVHAIEDGYVFERRGQPGAAVHTGYTVFKLSGSGRVIEVTAEIFEREWGWVEVGQSAVMTVRGLPGVQFQGKVVRVEPPVGYTTRSLEVALKFKTDNPAITQSMFAHVSIAGQPLRNVLVVPTDTIIRTGNSDRAVLVRGDGRYQPVEVVAGEESGGLIEVSSGLQEGQQVVASGQFLIDSESNLRAGFRRLTTPGAGRDDQARAGAEHADHSAH